MNVVRTKAGDENRRAKIRLDRALLNALLELPDGYNVAAIGQELDPFSIVVVVESADLDPQPFDQTLPALADGAFLRRVLRHNDEVWVRWEWMADVDEPAKTKVYISGPMTGLPAFNYPAFVAAADRLRTLGYEPLSPTDNADGNEHDWQWYMRAALRQIADADAIVTLPGWQDSRGARTEVQLADALGIPVTELSVFVENP